MSALAPASQEEIRAHRFSLLDRAGSHLGPKCRRQCVAIASTRSPLTNGMEGRPPRLERPFGPNAKTMANRAGGVAALAERGCSGRGYSDRGCGQACSSASISPA